MMKLFVKCGAPANLRHIEVIHVTHKSAEIEGGRLKDNVPKYHALCRELGVKAFHVGDLLYPEVDRNRPVVDWLSAEQ